VSLLAPAISLPLTLTASAQIERDFVRHVENGIWDAPHISEFRKRQVAGLLEEGAATLRVADLIFCAHLEDYFRGSSYGLRHLSQLPGLRKTALPLIERLPQDQQWFFETSRPLKLVSEINVADVFFAEIASALSPLFQGYSLAIVPSLAFIQSALGFLYGSRAQTLQPCAPDLQVKDLLKLHAERKHAVGIPFESSDIEEIYRGYHPVVYTLHDLFHAIQTASRLDPGDQILFSLMGLAMLEKHWIAGDLPHRKEAIHSLADLSDYGFHLLQRIPGRIFRHEIFEWSCMQ